MQFKNWAEYKPYIDDLLSQAPRQRYTPPAPVTPPAAATPNINDILASLGGQGGWLGGADGGMNGETAPGNLGDLMGSLGSFGPMAAGLAGGLLGTAVAGPFGGALGAWGGRSLAGLLGGAESSGAMNGSDPANAQSGASENSAANSGAAQGGNMMGDGTWQKGGYTGAGKDGVVQPHRKAGTVHEGELVIPHHVLRGLLAR